MRNDSPFLIPKAFSLTAIVTVSLIPNALILTATVPIPTISIPPPSRLTMLSLPPAAAVPTIAGLMIAGEVKLLEIEREHHKEARHKQDSEFLRLHNESMRDRALKAQKEHETGSQ